MFLKNNLYLTSCSYILLLMHIITYPSYFSNATLKWMLISILRQNTFLHFTNYCSLKIKKVVFIKSFCSLLYFYFLNE